MKSLLLASGALVLFGSSALHPALAHAADVPGAETDPATTVDSVIVTARRDPEDPAVVARVRDRLSRTPGAVSVVAAESYLGRRALALDDMLRDAPGVYAQRKWGGDVRISIRGSGIGNANHNRGLMLTQDGVPLNEADGYGDSQIADPLNVRYTEVYRGGNALRFGGALLGGAINMVTPTGATAGFDDQVRLEGGSWGLARQHVAIARQRGDLDGFFAVTNQTSQGWRPQSQQNIQFVALNVGKSFGEDREVRFILNGSNINQEIPGALTWAQFLQNPSQAAAANLAGDQARNQRGLRGSIATTWRLNEHLVAHGALYAVWKDLDHPIFQVIDQQSRNWGAYGRLDWDGEVFGKRTDGQLGAWLRTGDLDSNFYVNNRGARGAPTSISQQNADAVDVFGEGRLFVTEQLALVAGGSFGWTKRDYQSFAIAGQPTTFNLEASKEYQWLSPRIGLLWQGASGAQVYANLTRSVEPPNLGSMSPTGNGFAPIKAQEAWTGEIGTRGRRGPLTWDVTYYRAELNRELLQYAVTPDTPASTFNARNTRHQGIEAALDWRVTTRLKLRQTWTWSDFKFRNDRQFADNRMPIVPRHLYRAEAKYEHPAGWFIAPSVEWSASDIWVDYANTTKAPAYAILNLNGGWAINDKVSAFVDLRNLTDKAYVSNVQAAVKASAATAAYWPGDGRSAFGGLTVTF